MSRLERTSHICVIVLAVIASIAIIDQRIGAWRPASRNPARRLIGRTVAIPTVAWEQSPTNVVVAMTTHCPYCAASMPFYRKLATSLHAGPGKKSSLVIVSPEPVNQTTEYLEQQKVPADKVVSLPLQQLDVTGTPTLLILDNAGHIKHAFSGKLSESNETIVLNSLTEPLTPAAERQ